MTPNEIWRELTHPQRMMLGHHVAMNERLDDGRLQVIPNNAIVRKHLLAKGFIVHTGSEYMHDYAATEKVEAIQDRLRAYNAMKRQPVRGPESLTPEEWQAWAS